MFHTLSRKIALGFVTLIILLMSGMVVPQVASAVCVSPSIVFGRWRWCGYWYNRFQDAGNPVRWGGVPGGVNSAQTFINLIFNDLNAGTAQQRTGAAFIIRTMVGSPMAPLPSPPQPLGSGKLPNNSAHPIAQEWANRVRTYANAGETGWLSWGQNGTVEWFVSQHVSCGTGNTFYQPAFNDVAPYLTNAANSDCEIPSSREDLIIFRNSAGTPIYVIRRACMNPLGTLIPLDGTPLSSYNLTPSVTASIISGGSPIPGSVAEPGDTVNFTYAVNNTGPTAANNINCNIYANNHPGVFTIPTPVESSGSDPGVATGCPRNFPAGNTTIATESVPSVPANTTVCRSFWVNPAHSGAGSEGREACITVASKPYMRVYGGDVSVGNGQSTAPGTCVSNPNAAIVTWNRGAANGYAGAGVQFAAHALSQIFDFSTALGNAGGAAPVPSGLAFGNTAPSGSNFGGNLGSVPCITDFWDTAGASPYTAPNLTSLGTGRYAAAGPYSVAAPLTLSGTINPMERIVLYVQGDVLIDGNITYPASWNLTDAPLFQLVVRGNIYISRTVTQLDGIYIAGRSGGAGGTIYTCANPGAPAAAIQLTAAGAYSACNSRLTVNGAFIANQVQFLRTSGTLRQGTAGESGSSGSAAEVFNYSPAHWLAQPPGTGLPNTYDAITSLPPIL